MLPHLTIGGSLISANLDPFKFSNKESNVIIVTFQSIRTLNFHTNTSMAEWTKGLGLLVHNEVWCAGGCGFDPQTGQYTRRVFHPVRIPGMVFSENVSPPVGKH